MSRTRWPRRPEGADRLELVSDMGADGLTPALETFAAVRAAVGIPVRVMLRAEDGFAAGGAGGAGGALRDRAGAAGGGGAGVRPGLSR
ncbi:hypothetical protein GCM10020000_33700 [Streptomyces olivoverticillatus]